MWMRNRVFSFYTFIITSQFHPLKVLFLVYKAVSHSYKHTVGYLLLKLPVENDWFTKSFK